MLEPRTKGESFGIMVSGLSNILTGSGLRVWAFPPALSDEFGPPEERRALPVER